MALSCAWVPLAVLKNAFTTGADRGSPSAQNCRSACEPPTARETRSSGCSLRAKSNPRQTGASKVLYCSPRLAELPSSRTSTGRTEAQSCAQRTGSLHQVLHVLPALCCVLAGPAGSHRQGRHHRVHACEERGELSPEQHPSRPIYGYSAPWISSKTEENAITVMELEYSLMLSQQHQSKFR